VGRKAYADPSRTKAGSRGLLIGREAEAVGMSVEAYVEGLIELDLLPN
jgi:hypothetical protein